jgi:lactoylglutathione lyase
MELGAFSVSLSVKNMAAARKFYETLGFGEVGGDGAEWLILRNGDTAIGLFQGLFEGNILTFNPGWSAENQELESFTDIRELRKQLGSSELEISGDTTDQNSSGPASFMLVDPDGNVILIDQHV